MAPWRSSKACLRYGIKEHKEYVSSTFQDGPKMVPRWPQAPGDHRRMLSEKHAPKRRLFHLLCLRRCLRYDTARPEAFSMTRSENSKQPKKVRQTQTSTFGAAYLGTVLIAEFKATTSAYKHNQLQGEHPHPPQSITKSQDQTQWENHKIFQVIGSDRGNKIQDIPSHSYQCASSACRPSCRLRLSKAIAQSSICSSWIPMHTNAKVTSEPVACVSISEFPSPKIGGAACHRRVAVKLIIETLKNLAQQHDVHHRSLFTASGII